MKVTVVIDQGARPYMEDRFISTRTQDGSYGVFGVFDGHGGSEVAEYCSQHFLPHLERALQRASIDHQNSMEGLLSEVFRSVDAATRTSIPNHQVGSTALLALVSHDGRLWFATAGDSRGMLLDRQGHASLVTPEHKVEYEKARIEAAGGLVTYDDGVARVFRTLNVSRSIGDHFMKPYVIPDPHVCDARAIAPGDMLVLASDGIWDVFQPEELAQILHQHMREKQVPASALLPAILQLAKSRGSGDNMTLMTVVV